MPTVERRIPITPEAQPYRAAGAPELPDGYVEAEYFISGEVEGAPYLVPVHVARPGGRGTASATVIVEPTHGGNLWPVRSTTSAYIFDAGHRTIAVSASRRVIERLVTPANPKRYGTVIVPDRRSAETAILADVATLLRTDAALLLGEAAVDHLILGGYSGTGAVVRRFIATYPGAPVYDGYFPGQTAVGTMPGPIGDVAVPVIELQGESEVIRTFMRNPDGLTYRRDDGEHYRLYEVPSMPHMAGARGRWPCIEAVPTDFPLRAVWNNALNNLVRWVRDGAPAPAAEPIALDGDKVVRDDHGHAVGGVRVVDIDVPTAILGAVSTARPDAPAGARADMLGHRIDFPPDQLAALYGDHATYLARFEARLDELVAAHWYLPADADAARAAAATRSRLFLRQ